MNAIRIIRRLESETLPELRPLLGKKVEIIVLAEVGRTKATSSNNARRRTKLRRPPRWTKPSKSVEDLAREQGVKPVKRISDLMGGWPVEELNDGFIEARNDRRRQEVEIERKRMERRPK